MIASPAPSYLEHTHPKPVVVEKPVAPLSQEDRELFEVAQFTISKGTLLVAMTVSGGMWVGIFAIGRVVLKLIFG